MATRKRTSSNGFSSAEEVEVETFLEQTVDEVLEDIEAAEEFLNPPTPEPEPEPQPELAPAVEEKAVVPPHENPKPNPSLITRPRRNIPRFAR